MRMIDADALVNSIKRMYCTDCNSYGGVRCRACAVGDALDMIDDSPTVDAEPVRHCENVTHTHPSDMFVCSRCGFSCEITELRHDEDDMENHDAYEYDCKFCPDCGAKADGGAEDENS